MTRIKKYKNKYKYKKTRIHQNAGGLKAAVQTLVKTADTSLVRAAKFGNTAVVRAETLVRQNPLVNSAFKAKTAAEKVLANTGQNIKNKFISQFEPAKKKIIEEALSNIQKNKVLIAARDEIKRQLKGEVKGQITDFSKEQLEKFFNPQKPNNNSTKVNTENAKVRELVNLMRKNTVNSQNTGNPQKPQTRQNLQQSSIQKPILGINTLGRMFNQSKKNIPTNSKLTLTNNEKREVLKHFLEHREMYNNNNMNAVN